MPPDVIYVDFYRKPLEIPAGKENLGQQDAQQGIESGVDHHGIAGDEAAAEGRSTDAADKRRLEDRGCAPPEGIARHDEAGENSQVDQSMDMP
jgi:hypothetical protein